MSAIPDPFSTEPMTVHTGLNKAEIDEIMGGPTPERYSVEGLPKPTISDVDPLEMPKVPEGGELEHMQALAQQVDWPTLFIEAVPPETWRKFRALAKGKTDLERLQDLIRQVEYE